MKKRIAVRTAHMTVRLAPEKLDAYLDAAKLDGRTLTNWVEWNLDRIVNRRNR